MMARRQAGDLRLLEAHAGLAERRRFRTQKAAASSADANVAKVDAVARRRLREDAGRDDIEQARAGSGSGGKKSTAAGFHLAAS